MLDLARIYSSENYGFKVKVLAAVPNPQQLIYLAMHQCVSSSWVGELESLPSEQECGRIIVENLLKGDRGHYGCLEEAGINFSCGYINHATVVQARTHRVGMTFDVQSMRYTKLEADNLEQNFFLRPVGVCRDRTGAKYDYTEERRSRDLGRIERAFKDYQTDIDDGAPAEHARRLLPSDYRQHFNFGCNARSLMHFLDLRAKADAQDEVRVLSDLLWQAYCAWVPEIAEWYQAHRFGKAKLAP